MSRSGKMAKEFKLRTVVDECFLVHSVSENFKEVGDL